MDILFDRGLGINFQTQCSMSIPHWISLDRDSSSPVGYILLLSRKFVKIQILLLTNLEIYNLSLIVETVRWRSSRRVTSTTTPSRSLSLWTTVVGQSSAGDHPSFHVVFWRSLIISCHLLVIIHHLMLSSGDHWSYYVICWSLVFEACMKELGTLNFEKFSKIQKNLNITKKNKKKLVLYF